ncbi:MULTISPECIES: TetR/AcrR family transcriptional regulator [Mycobacteroides]|uniref:TetR family transcriptional regulator n=1 Tax=Mycobacteroides immunogenum TaxID=83262 RepID=A0A179V724_9MYCO|nr:MULTISPECIES: TetR/AcrR family transcriptional regulator [Mycobacteroides]MBF9315602.1 TetR/AcrR family transcriptional regulator [Mycobacteroides chelonae]OAT66775.1 TetR family transcriptional regulator [Mycobacteroides immunogenum]OHT75399.1 TetR family transcriptional regulator [Mycobacteroides chelonae]OHT75520.1 TetR family transcriptional regulator [Mycobacteroides chelonae]OHT91982.1 TetR family transcriptional regulator [Mycobacteroides chelonae]
MSTRESPDTGAQDEEDPRRVRSRNRLLDAAASLLNSGGIEAVTIDAVTGLSKVARTTLYRHFTSSTHLIAATFERLLPQVTAPAPTSGTLRERLIELLTRQAALLTEAPLHLTTLAWVALGPTALPEKTTETTEHNPSTTLRTRVIDQYRQPFDAILHSTDAHEQLGNLDIDLAICQLVGPLVFARLTGLSTLTQQHCTHIVDNFLTTHTAQMPQIQ